VAELDDEGRVIAAGGVVWRDAPGGIEVLVVHRPTYDDWSFPKGKLEPGETAEQAALREVEEETGLVCRLGAELPPSEYVDNKGRPKVVRYWTMQAASGEPRPDTEVDALEWLGVDEARERLSYADDRALLDALLIAPERAENRLGP
jgi:8-oxo-dGTP diphosphatase